MNLKPIINPAGSDGQIQYNNNGVFGGEASLSWDDANNRLGINEASPGAQVHIQTSGTGIIGLLLKATASQTADMLRITDSSDNVRITANKDGQITLESSSAQITLTDTAQGGGGNQNAKLKFDDGGNNSLDLSTGLASDANKITLSPRTNVAMTLLGSGQVGVGVTSPAETLQVDDAIAISNDAEGSTARLTRRSTHETHTLTLGTTSDTTTISIPSGVRLLGVSMNVNTVVTDDAGDDTWSAAFIAGSTTTIVTGAAAAQNTKVDFIVPDEKTTAVAQIQFTPQGGSFSAGVIEIVAYYEELTSLANV